LDSFFRSPFSAFGGIWRRKKDNQQVIVHTQRGSKGAWVTNSRFSMTGTILCSKSRTIVSDRGEKRKRKIGLFPLFSETAKERGRPVQTLALVMVDFDRKNG
jgi:hypothetical protein